MEQKQIRILYIEDQLTNYEGVNLLLTQYPEYKLDWAKDLEQARQRLETEDLDLIILDLGLGPGPKQDISPSIDFLLEIKEKYPKIKILIFSDIAFLQPETVRIAVKYNVSYLVKQDLLEGKGLHQSIQTTLLGRTVFSNAVLPQIDYLISGPKTTLLSAKELQVASLVHKQMTNRAIAYELDISEAHARDLVSKVIASTGSSNRAGVAVWFEKNYPDGL